jgi:hypothetical protein
MATLVELREELAALVEDATGISAVAYLPERPVPPIALISQGSPYIQYEDTNTFNTELMVRLRVDLVVATATNTVSTDRLDEVIELAVSGLLASDWFVDTVSAPYSLNANNANYLTVTLTVTKPKSF